MVTKSVFDGLIKDSKHEKQVLPTHRLLLERTILLHFVADMNDVGVELKLLNHIEPDSVMTVRSFLNKLKSRGWITEIEYPEDKRRKILVKTPKFSAVAFAWQNYLERKH